MIICTEAYLLWLREELPLVRGVVTNIAIITSWGAGVVATFDYGVPPWNHP